MPPDPARIRALPSPWAGFLRGLDELLLRPVELHCLGGFVLTVCYGLPRPTADVDVFAILPAKEQSHLEELAGRESKLARQHRVYLQYVGVVSLPENYEHRLFEIFPEQFRHLRILAPDPYDLALSKLERNSPKDRADLEYLVKRVSLNPNVLRERYQKELRPYLARPDWHDKTLDLWLDVCFPAVGDDAI